MENPNAESGQPYGSVEEIDFGKASNDLSGLIDFAIQQRRNRVRAEVEMMDWPDTIGECEG